LKAKVRAVWLIVECPHCMKPQSVRKIVIDNMVIGILKVRYETCEFCDEGFFIELEGSEELYGLG
jgi:hypothetical protein